MPSATVRKAHWPRWPLCSSACAAKTALGRSLRPAWRPSESGGEPEVRAARTAPAGAHLPPRRRCSSRLATRLPTRRHARRQHGTRPLVHVNHMCMVVRRWFAVCSNSFIRALSAAPRQRVDHAAQQQHRSSGSGQCRTAPPCWASRPQRPIQRKSNTARNTAIHHKNLLYWAIQQHRPASRLLYCNTAIQRNTAQYSAIQRNTAQYSAIQQYSNTAQYSIQHNTIPLR